MAQLTSSGSASYKFVPGPGTHSYIAVFVGTNSYAGSTSLPAPLIVSDGTSGVSAVGIQASGGQGDYDLLGTVAPAGMVSPSGQVSFLDTTNSNYQLGTAALTPTGASNTSFLQSFSLSFPLGAGVRPGYVATGDFNNDGHQDILFASDNLGAVYTLLGNGDGTFTTLSFPFAVQSDEAPLVADFNGDGKLDFVLRTKTGLAVFLGNGDGTFTAGPALSVAPLPTFTVADLNDDGIPDLLVGNGASLYAYLGDGSGGFAAPKLAFQGIQATIFTLTADFNGDGNTDVLLLSAFGVPQILLGNGDGTFRSGPANPFSALGVGVSAGTVGDLNADGKPDVVIAEDFASNPPFVLLGNGDATFNVLPKNPQLISASNAVTLADFNGDGILDVVFPNLYGGETNVYIGRGDGTFTPDIYSPGLAYFTSESLATADFNGDGQADITEVFQGDFNELVVLLSQSASTAAGYANNISPVGTGYHYVDAFYPGDANNPAGTSQTIALLAEQVQPNLSLTALPAGGSLQGQAVTLTASLDQFFAQNHNATGTVTFTSNGNPVGTAQIANGTASLTTSALAAGVDSLQAEYAGDTNFEDADSAPLTYTVTPRQSQTITFPQPASPAYTGTSVLLTATASSGLPVAYTVISGPATVSGNTLTFTAAGTVVVAADQAGNTNYTAAVEVARTIIVLGRLVSVGLTASPNPVFLQNPLSLVVTLAATGGIPTGSVTFLDSTNPLGTVAISGSSATLITTALTLGVHSITAIYSGDNVFAQLTSSPVAVTVQDFTLTVTNPSVTIDHGGTSTYNLILSSVGGIGMASTVNLSITGAPDHSEIAFTPSVVPSGSGSTPVTLVIHTPNYPVGPWSSIQRPAGTIFACMTLGALFLSIPRRKRLLPRPQAMVKTLLVLTIGFLSLVGLSGCGSGWRTQVWTMQVTATSGALSRSATLTLTSQCSDGRAACPIE